MNLWRKFRQWRLRRWRTWLGIEAKSPIDETLSYQSRRINAINDKVEGWAKRFKAADAERLDALARRMDRAEETIRELDDTRKSCTER